MIQRTHSRFQKEKNNKNNNEIKKLKNHTVKTFQIRIDIPQISCPKKTKSTDTQKQIKKNLTNGESELGNQHDACDARSVEGLSTEKGHLNTAYVANGKPAGTEEMCSSTTQAGSVRSLTRSLARRLSDPAHGGGFRERQRESAHVFYAQAGTKKRGSEE